MRCKIYNWPIVERVRETREREASPAKTNRTEHTFEDAQMPGHKLFKSFPLLVSVKALKKYCIFLGVDQIVKISL